LNILVTGSKGQLGSEFKCLEEDSEHHFQFTDSKTLDITDIEALNFYFNKNHIDLIINCAAYTAVDQAEDDVEKALSINRDAIYNLVNICEKHQIALIHFSTDYVFDGQNYKPYTEDDAVSPLGVYGQSKRAGEEAILNSKASSLIVRTSWLYSKYGHNFMKSMLRLGQERDQLQIVYDQIGTPTHARDLAKAMMTCVSQYMIWQNKQSIYHYANEGVASWYDFAKAIFDKEAIDCKLIPILSKDYPTKAKRPHYSVMDKNKFKTVFGIEILHWQDSLKSL
jgi:dTDP-4-dehydrorhamnose reductase